MIKNNFFISIVLLLSIHGQSVGQDYSVSFSGVYGTYEMGDLKNFQSELFLDAKSSIDVPFKITDNFPSYIGYEFNAELRLEKMFVGFQVATRTTGGRISYSDYSGRFNIDNNLYNIEFSCVFGTNLYSLNKIRVRARSLVGMAINNHNLSSHFQLLGEEPVLESLDFASTNLFIGIGIGVNYFLHKNIYLKIETRGDLHIPGELHFNNNKNAVLINNNGSAIKVDWTGFRGLFGIGFQF